MPNAWIAFKALIPDAALLVGVVLTSDESGTLVELPDGSRLSVRGVAEVDACVFIRDGVIEGAAPNLPTLEIEI